jgi:hypothetical protein
VTPRSRPTIARLAEASVRDDSGCALFTGYLDKQGYGRILHDGEKRLVHRVAYELCIGPIPDGYEVDHLCGIRNCVNPAHLEAVTAIENTRRAAGGHAQQTHCDHGHEFTPENTRIVDRPNGKQRACRRCDARRARESRARRAA